jgi:F0F1-type ATP synthase delta subunit
MINFNVHYAHGLIEYSESLGIFPGLYHAAESIMEGSEEIRRNLETDALVRYMKIVPPKKRKSVLRRFLALAHEKLELMDVEVYSPFPLTDAQISILSRNLVKLFKKNPVITIKVDKSLLGGVRVIAGKNLLDDSIKQNFSAMRQALYEEVLMNAK